MEECLWHMLLFCQDKLMEVFIYQYELLLASKYHMKVNAFYITVLWSINDEQNRNLNEKFPKMV